MADFTPKRSVDQQISLCNQMIAINSWLISLAGKVRSQFDLQIWSSQSMFVLL